MSWERRVVVTGLGLVTPLGLGIEDNWQKIMAGVSGIRRVSLSSADELPIKAVGEVREQDLAVMKRFFREDTDPEGEKRTLFALWSAQSALEDAGSLNHNGINKECGIILAAGLGINRLEDLQRWTDRGGRFDYQAFGRQYGFVHRESMIRNNAHRPAALIARKYGLNGCNFTITSACAAATQAIGLGFRMIRRGDAEMILAGGADSMINPMGLMTFILLKAASLSSESPKEVCRPFDRKRSGLVMGEGGGIVVLEEERTALKRGARIYAEVVGYGTSLDAFQVTAPHPEGRGAEKAMRDALADGVVSAGEVRYINAHGTGTKLNDIAETLAIKKVFGEHAREIPISSSKSMIGHLIAAAGGPEFIYTVLSVERDEIHPTINLTNPDPKCDLDYVAEVGRKTEVPVALSNSFGFGGQNASVVVKKYTT